MAFVRQKIQCEDLSGILEDLHPITAENLLFSMQELNGHLALFLATPAPPPAKEIRKWTRTVQRDASRLLSQLGHSATTLNQNSIVLAKEAFGTLSNPATNAVEFGYFEFVRERIYSADGIAFGKELTTAKTVSVAQITLEQTVLGLMRICQIADEASKAPKSRFSSPNPELVLAQALSRVFTVLTGKPATVSTLPTKNGVEQYGGKALAFSRRVLNLYLSRTSPTEIENIERFEHLNSFAAEANSALPLRLLEVRREQVRMPPPQSMTTFEEDEVPDFDLSFSHSIQND